MSINIYLIWIGNLRNANLYRFTFVWYGHTYHYVKLKYENSHKIVNEYFEK